MDEQEFVDESARKESATELRRRTLERMERELAQSRREFHESLFRLHDEVDNYSIYVDHGPSIKMEDCASPAVHASNAWRPWPISPIDDTVRGHEPPMSTTPIPPVFPASSPPMVDTLCLFGAPRDWNPHGFSVHHL